MEEQLEFNLQDSQPVNMPQLVLELTGNPWTDFGIVSLCQDLSFSERFFPELRLTANQAIITVATNVDMAAVEEWLNQTLQARWNQLFWLSRGAKILGHASLTYDDDHFINRDRPKRQITADELTQIKEKWKGSQIKTDEEMHLTQWRFNFIGTPADAQRFRKNQKRNIRDFIQNWQEPAGKKLCEMSGRPTPKLKKLLQVVNPFANKHHNTKVRGVFASSVNPEVGALYYLINLFTTLDEGIPFIYNPAKKVTSLILPEVSDLSLLSKIYKRLKVNLRDDLREKELYPYTNLCIRHQLSNRYALAISLFHNIFYEFTVTHEKDSSEGIWAFSPMIKEREQIERHLTRWAIIPFIKGQNVQFQNFQAVQVNARLYDFIKPIPCQQNEIQLVPDILARISPKPRAADGENALAQLNQAIATSSPYLLKRALFNLWKHTDAITYRLKSGKRHPARLLQPFINHFLEVNNVLDDKSREDLRALGTIIGRTFNKDVTLISKLFNISSLNAFRETLNLVMFRLYKFSTSENVKNAVPVKQERIDNILTKVTEANYKEIAETLSTYASLSAYTTNVFDSKSNNNGGQDD